MDGHDGRVHFPTDQVIEHDSEIIVKKDSEEHVSVHLGFLEIHHQYEIRFTIKDTLGEDVLQDPLQNLHVKILEIPPSEDGEGHEVVLDLHAHKEKLWKEELIITNTDKTASLTITLHARVLGKGKGTPSLKTGIHCTGINVDDDSEQGSDWQGFD
ncbi:unnamed protein product [Owenia fusiformis]|nr:unnamed protein product [Owenia fusiformis]